MTEPVTTTQPPADRDHLPIGSIAMVSAAALAYEVLLIRLFSITQWHHLAYMIISLALLGYGVSGTVLSLAGPRLLQHFRTIYPACLGLFGLGAVGCFAATGQIAMNPEAMLWDPREMLHLVLTYLLLAIPFFFAATAIGLALMRYPGDITRLYAADLLGAGAGSIAIIGLLFIVLPGNALPVIGLLGIAAALLGGYEVRTPKTGFWPPAIVSVLIILLAMGADWTRPILSPYKDLSQTLRVTGTKIIDQRSSPLGVIETVESPVIPLRHAPGMSLNAVMEPPEQLGIFTDGDGMSVITRDTGKRERLSYLDQMPSALPYHLTRIRDVLVLGAGGGTRVLQARYHGAERIDAVEQNPQIIELLEGKFAEFSGHLYKDDNSRFHIAEIRGFMSREDPLYDLIGLTLLNATGAAGLYALQENYTFTVEALKSYLNRLKPNGYLSIDHWIQLPPRDVPKLFATAIQALQELGLTEPGLHMALIRGWQTGVLLIKKTPLTPEEIKALKKFCEERSFDTAYYPGMPVEEANQYTLLKQPYFFQAAQSLLATEQGRFVEDYKFDIRPATDDRPYFFHFLKWRVLPEILELRDAGGRSLLESGYMLLLATLGQALLASVALILLPVLLKRLRSSGETQTASRGKTLTYFFSLGLAFLFLEIAFIQKLVLFLHHPVYAVAITLTAFLAFSGLGSAWSQRFIPMNRHTAGIRTSVSGIVLFGLGYVLALDWLVSHLMLLPVPVKFIVATGLIAPLAFCMGQPFPLGLSILGRKAPAQIPWAWGLNGCASVISAVLATLIAIHFGFTAVVVLAVLLYLIAAFTVP